MTMIKDPDAKLDFGFNWRVTGKEWLETDETIISYVITVPTVPSGIAFDGSSESNGIVTVWLSGGTAGINYKVACKITTSKGRIDERTIWIKVTDR